MKKTFAIGIAGAAGQGVATPGDIFAKILSRRGSHLNDAGKYFWRSGREKCFSLDIPFNRLLARNEFQIARDLTGTKLSVDTNGKRAGAVHGTVRTRQVPRLTSAACWPSVSPLPGSFTTLHSSLKIMVASCVSFVIRPVRQIRVVGNVRALRLDTGSFTRQICAE
jgi:hypothetical protein